MKTFLPTLIVLSSLLSLVSCGQGGQSSASLQVSRGFLMTNPKFGGGLVITGKKLNATQSFSVSLDSTMSTTLKLEKGIWLIAAVGWDGGTAPEKVFAGDTYCGWTQAVLDSDNVTIDLSVAKEKCADTSAQTNGENVFAAGQVETSGGNRFIKSLDLITTCNSFYTSFPTYSSSVSTLDAKNGFSTTYCNNLTDLQGDVKSLRIFSVNQAPGQILPRTGLDSGCIKATNQTVSTLTGTGNPFNGRGAPRLPLNNIPFIIQTYEEDDCTKPVANFHFKKGLAQAHAEDFDHELVSESSSQVKLLLPGSDVKRARSPFLALLPYVKKYNSGSIGPYTTVPASLPDYEIPKGVNASITLDNVSACSTVSPSGVIDAGPTCTDLGDKVRLDFIASGAGDGSGSLTMTGAGTIQIYFVDNTAPKHRYDSQKALVELVGNSNPNIPQTFFWPGTNKDDDFDKTYGALSEVREMLVTAGSVIGISGSPSNFASACSAASGSKEIEVFSYDRMEFEKYKVTVASASSSPNPAFCNIDNPSESDCSTNGVTFDKKMAIYDYKQSTTVPMMVFEFNCSTLVGKMEINSSEIEGVRKHEKKKIISWNTDLGGSFDLHDQRFELLQIKKDYLKNVATSTFVQIGEHRRLARVQKYADEFDLWNYESHSNKNLAGNWDQDIGSQQVKYAAGDVCYQVTRQNLANDTTYDALLNSNSNQNVAPSTSQASLKFGVADALNTAQTACSAGNFTNLVQVDTNTDGIDDNNADKFNGVLPFKLNSLRSTLLDAQFGGAFFTP